MKRIDLNIPQPILMGTTYRFWRSEIEHEKARIRALSRGLPAPEYTKPDSDTLVPSDVIAGEFGISRRTLARRIKEIQDASKVAG